MTFKDDVADFIRTEALFYPGQPVVVGVSGGPDSLCLLDVLRRLGYSLVVAHFDHGLRPESSHEAQRVQEMAAKLGLDFELEQGALGVERSFREGSLEAAARHARYRFLLRVATERGAQRLATGHTADDQVETMLMNLLRGAGPDGLRGMVPLTPIGRWPEFGPGIAPNVALARPLLRFGRAETQAYCDRHGLEPVMDPSNQDLAFLRNRVRHDLLGRLETYNPEVRQALLRTSQIMGDVADLMDEQVDRAWGSWVRLAGEAAVALNNAGFERQSPALQRRLLRRAFEYLGIPTREVGFESVERMRAAIRRQIPARLALPGGLSFERVGEEWLLAEPDAEAAFPGYPLLDELNERPIPDSGVVDLASGWRLSVQRQTRETIEGRTSDAVPKDTCAVFDADRIVQPVVLRAHLRGERLSPMGMSGTVKLSDLFTDHKIPRRLRRRWPVISSGAEILWVPGLRRGRLAPLEPSTCRIVRLNLIPPSSA